MRNGANHSQGEDWIGRNQPVSLFKAVSLLRLHQSWIREIVKMAGEPMTKISRRSTRYFIESEGPVKEGALESRYGSSSDETDKEKPQREATSSSTTIEVGMIPMVDLGKDLGIFPKSEDMGKHGVYPALWLWTIT